MTRIPLRITCGSPSRHHGHPVSVGVPLPRGLLGEAAHAALADPSGSAVPMDAVALALWPDGSVKWLRVRFLAAGEFGPSASAYHVEIPGPPGKPSDGPSPSVREEGDRLIVDTGVARFHLDRNWLRPFLQVEVDGEDRLEPEPAGMPPVILRDAAGLGHRFRIRSLKAEHAGRVAVDLVARGVLEGEAGAAFCEATCRLSFHAGTALVRMAFTLWNPRAAAHPGGIWDLGDSGSVFFRGLTFPFRLRKRPGSASILGLHPLDGEYSAVPAGGSVHQGSSGGADLDHPAHADRNNQVTPKFKGYRVDLGGKVSGGMRANPVAIHPVPGDGEAGFGAALEDFWQAFPKRLELAPGLLSVEPFPDADGQEFELQGGERALSVAWLDFKADPARPGEALLPARLPLVACPDPAWCADSGCLPYFSPAAIGEDGFFRGLMDGALTGERSFLRRREEFEEYGWRNFGEVAADHEKLHYQGKATFVSHYNNQYDLVLAFLSQFLRTGDAGWFGLGRDLSRHVMHVDLYHTDKDKSAYNGGYFWHTAHYMHAGKATHRTFSRLADGSGGPPPAGFGGGPSNEHDYATGLGLFHLLTGDPDAKEAVLGLARWVRDIQDGNLTPLRFLSRNETGLATATRELAWQGPGRGAGYSINTSLDAYAITGDPAWLAQAERYIRICIHPSDDPDALGLLNREDRWSYVVFLQALGKYLDAKMERGARDESFAYAHACLLRFARWMADKEYPYLDKPEELEYPTSTWPAQDLRKTCVFLLAARFASPAEAKRFEDRAAFFFGRAGDYLRTFDDADSARNLVLILNHAPMFFHWKARKPDWNAGLPEPVPPVWPKVVLVPQKIQAKQNLRRIVFTFGLAGLAQLLRFLAVRGRGRKEGSSAV